MDNCLVPPVPAGACLRGCHDSAASILASLAIRRASMAKVVKYIKVNQKMDVHFVVMRLSYLTRKCLVRDMLQISQYIHQRWRLHGAQDNFITLCVCRHQNTRVQVTVQNLRTGECFQVLVCWRK